MMNKTKSKSKRFSEKVHFLNILVVCLILVGAGLFNVINNISIDRYSESVTSLQRLSSFYDNVNLMSTHVKDYVYKEDMSAEKKYLQYYHNAQEDIKKLESLVIVEEKWRFSLLENMLINYMDLTDQLITEKEGYVDHYNTFLKVEELIQNTSDEYYKVITNIVNGQLQNIKVFKNITLMASCLLVLCLLFWLIYYSSQLNKAITKPMHLLLKNITKVKRGKYDLSQISGASREMEDLCDALNDMALTIANNIEVDKKKTELEKQVLVWKNENLKKEELLAQSELKMLQNQINPHFLFNTLNMIYKMALQEGADDAADLLVKTSQLLRYVLDKQGKISNIQSEVEILKNYIVIQERRLGDRVTFTLNFESPKEIGDVAMPGMILQPLVENAIKHGLKDCLIDGVIEITVKQSDSVIYICVSDNGCGMECAEIDTLMMNDFQNQEGNHLGLYNVTKRLKMYYHDDVSISINSDIDCGFEVIIKIVR